MTETDKNQTQDARPFSQVFRGMLKAMLEYADHPDTPPHGSEVFYRILARMNEDMPDFGGDGYEYKFPRELCLDDEDDDDEA
ncbi:MAG: hypothetical protein ACREA2_10875 [Blastocatellia bacterium]